MAIIFDFDGTIADSFEAAVQIFYQLSGHHQVLPPEEIERLRGLSLLHAAEELHVHPWKLPFLLARGRRRIGRHIDQIAVQPGMPGVIKQLHAEGHQLFILTSNSSRNVLRFLEQHQMKGYFQGVYGSVSLFGKKKALRRLLRRKGLASNDTLYIGDELRDIEAAQALNIPIIAVTWGFTGRARLKAEQPTGLVDKPSQLLAVIANANIAKD